jgi:hypothetical protein
MKLAVAGSLTQALWSDRVDPMKAASERNLEKSNAADVPATGDRGPERVGRW